MKDLLLPSRLLMVQKKGVDVVARKMVITDKLDLVKEDKHR